MLKKKCLNKILLLLLLLNVSCLEEKDKSSSLNKAVIREDIDPVISRFPKLKKIERVYWIAEVIGNSRSICPGPSSYYMKGYIILDEEQSNSFRTLFSWEKMDEIWKPTWVVKEIAIDKLKWLYSKEFDLYIKSANFVGKFYFNQQRNLLFFDVQ